MHITERISLNNNQSCNIRELLRYLVIRELLRYLVIRELLCYLVIRDIFLIMKLVN